MCLCHFSHGRTSMITRPKSTLGGERGVGIGLLGDRALWVGREGYKIESTGQGGVEEGDAGRRFIHIGQTRGQGGREERG